jgi:hypothetical protein
MPVLLHNDSEAEKIAASTALCLTSMQQLQNNLEPCQVSGNLGDFKFQNVYS